MTNETSNAMEDLILDRFDLSCDVSSAECAVSDRQSSAAYHKLAAATKALADFDSAHPEVIVEIRRQKAEEAVETDPWNL